jgi:hypothetical protein
MYGLGVLKVRLSVFGIRFPAHNHHADYQTDLRTPLFKFGLLPQKWHREPIGHDLGVVTWMGP